MLLIALGLGTVALPQVYRLGGAIRQTLYNNYTRPRGCGIVAADIFAH